MLSDEIEEEEKKDGEIEDDSLHLQDHVSRLRTALRRWKQGWGGLRKHW